MTRILEPTRGGARLWPRIGARTGVLVAASVLLIAVAGWHYWTLASSLREARTELLAAQAGFAGVALDVSATDLAASASHADRADASFARAERHIRYDPLIRLASVLPGIGPQVDASTDLVEAGRISAAIASEAAAAGEQFVVIREEARGDEPLASTLARGIEMTRPRIERIEALSSKLRALRLEIGDRALLPPLASARDQLDAELPALLSAVDNLSRAHGVLPGFLGFEGERRYLVLALNNGELLPGGGLVSAAGVLTANEGDIGQIDFTDSTRWKSAWEEAGGSYIEPPGPLKRYLLRDYTWNLLVSNWNPDFPTWSQQALEFYELVHGEQQVDGVVALDLEVLRRLLALTGPRTIEVDGYGAVTFTADNAILELERTTRQSFEEAGDRKSVIGDLARVLLDDVTHLPSSQWDALADIVRGLGEEGHFQMLSFHGEEQGVVREAGWDGALERADGDYVHFNEASVNSTKLNLIVQPSATYGIEVTALGDAHHELALSYENPLPEWQKDKDPKLVKELMLGGVYGGYLRVFGPSAMTGWSTSLDGVPAAVEDTELEGNLRWFGMFMRLPAGMSAKPVLRWTVPFATRAPGARSYDLTIQKQPGTAGMCLDLVLTREGRAPSHLEVQGGTRDAQDRICLTTDVHVKAEWE